MDLELHCPVCVLVDRKDPCNSSVTDVHWSEVPGRDDAWKEQTIANTSEAQFEQEYGNSFLGTGNTLINSETLLGMMTETPQYTKDCVNVYEKPKFDLV